MKLIGTLLSCFVLFCVSAEADTIYNFNLTGSGVTSSGSITVSLVNSKYEITAISGTYADTTASGAFSGTISGLVAGSYSATNYSTNTSSSSQTIDYDNLFYPSGSAASCNATSVNATDKLDVCGVLFTVTANGSTYYVNLFGESGTSAVYNVIDYKASGQFLAYNLPVAATFTTAVTPEPSTWLLTATGLFGAGGVLRRRLICG